MTQISIERFSLDSKIANAEYRFLQALRAIAETYEVNFEGLEYAMKDHLKDCLRDLGRDI